MICIKILIGISQILALSVAIDDYEDLFFRTSRNPSDRGVRFGWQNPIRVAPTLAPLYEPSTPRQYLTPAPFYPNPETTPRSEYFPVQTFPPTRRPYSTPRPKFPNPNSEYYPTQRPSYPTSTQTFDREREQFEKLPEAGAQRQEACPPQSRKGKRNGKCYELGSSAPCSENMAFYEDPLNREFGQCDCLQNLNRPLVYHSGTDKCYFTFQQAYCQTGEWLILDNGRPLCDANRCIAWTQSRAPNWDWTSNGANLAFVGTIALVRERSCAALGSSCSQEGREQLRPLLEENSRSGIRLLFSGEELVCKRDSPRTQPQDTTIRCKDGLINKWKLDGRCK